MVTGVVFGAIAGWIVGRWAEQFPGKPRVKVGTVEAR